MVPIEAWWAAGERLPIEDADVERRLFTRVEGSAGPWTTFFHGFPSSSWDWAPVLAKLPPGRRRLLFDHLGFGDSDKPRDHAYTFDGQIALALALWRRHAVDETVLVAHDYSVSMAQEILARIDAGRWEGPRIRGVLLLNGGLLFSRQKPLLVQRLLRGPLGPLASRLVTRRTFDRAFSRIFAPGRVPQASELDDHWRAITRHEGLRIYHLLSDYHEERRRHEARWGRALATREVRVRYAWGLLDPVSGEAMIRGVQQLVPSADVVEWDDVGHYPQLEVPERVAAILAEAERAW